MLTISGGEAIDNIRIMDIGMSTDDDFNAISDECKVPVDEGDHVSASRRSSLIEEGRARLFHKAARIACVRETRVADQEAAAK